MSHMRVTFTAGCSLDLRVNSGPDTSVLSWARRVPGLSEYMLLVIIFDRAVGSLQHLGVFLFVIVFDLAFELSCIVIKRADVTSHNPLTGGGSLGNHFRRVNLGEIAADVTVLSRASPNLQSISSSPSSSR